MKLEIRSHYWPATPHLREIKLYLDGELIRNDFLNKNQIWELAKQLRNFDVELQEEANRMDE